MHSGRDSSYVSLTAACQGICFVHPVPASTSPPKTSAGIKGVTTQGKTSSEHKSNALSGKITIDHVSIVDFKICRRAISILCSFASLKIGHLVKYSVKYSKRIKSRDLEQLTSLLPRRNQQRKFSCGFLFIGKSF